MFESIKNAAVNMGLKTIREKFMDPNFEGIGEIKQIAYKDKKFFLTIVLEGLEDRPVSVVASDIRIAPDASSIAIGNYESNMPFAMNALNRFATKPFAVPEGGARVGLMAAKKALGL